VSEPRRCPDGGTCHHECGDGGCFRVAFAGPLSGVYPHDEWPADVMTAQAIRGPRPAQSGGDDLFRVEVVPGLTVCADVAGCVVIEAERPERLRYPVPDPAVLVVAVETARDVGSGAPMEGSPMQAAITGMTEIAAALDVAGESGVAVADAADRLRQLAGDLGGAATLRHRPGCPGRD